MDTTRDHSLTLRLSIAILCFFLAASSLVLLCDARRHGRIFQNPKLNHRISSSNRPWKNLKSLNRFLDTSNSPFIDFSSFDSSYGSPSSLALPPFNSEAPQPTPSGPSSSSSPHPAFAPPNLPDYSPITNPPRYYHPPPPPGTPLSPNPSPPPKHGPSPPKAYLPPLVYPPPPPPTPSARTASSPPPPPPPPPHNKRPRSGHWCVAKPTVPDQIIKQAMDYACGSGADCKEIQPNGPCYEPNSMLAHASYAFNSYWQNTKAAGGTCDFGGTAMLVTVDPSFERCHFNLT